LRSCGRVAELNDKVQNALDETRMLILGAQVLLGFQFQSIFQSAFDQLPAPVQLVKLVGLGLMLLAVGLLVAPAAFHQIAELGDDSRRLLRFTTRIAEWALMPFALGLGIDVYVAVLVVLGAAPALPAGIAALAFAVFWWYGLEWIVRRRRADHTSTLEHPRVTQQAPGPTKLEDKIRQVLTEARVVLPGVQALLGFQFAAMLMDGFAKLPRMLQYVHLASLALIAASIVFLISPAAFHRIVEGGEDSERMHRFSSAMVVTAMVPLALGISGDFYVVASKVLRSEVLALALAGASLVFFYGLWFGVTLAVRRLSPSAR
jgi:hypothetical protein